MIRRLSVLALVATICGCEGGAPVADRPPADAGKGTTLRPSAKTYPLVGEVLKVDAEGGKVTVRHEAIPDFMPAMTMNFRVADKEKPGLADLQVGDKIGATLRVGGDHSELDDLNVTEPAPPKALTLDMSGKTPTLRERTPRLEPGQAVPDFEVTTQDGETLRLSDLRGKVVVLTFIYTSCPLPDFCPRMDAKFAELSGLVASSATHPEKVRLLSISFDPEHDTPAVLARHAKLKGAKPPLWRFAVASHAELRKVAEPLGLMYGPTKDEIVHNLSTAVIGPDGKLAALLGGSSWTPQEVFKVVLAHVPH